MASTYKTPGVYVEEISLFPPSVAAVETAIPAFIGYTQKATEKEAEDLLFVPKRITSLLEYRTYFGESLPETTITVRIDDTTVKDKEGNVVNDSGGNPLIADRKTSASIGTPSPHNMYYSLQGFFANGGGPCYIISVGIMEDAGGVITAGDDTEGLIRGIDEARQIDEITLFVLPELQNSTDYAGTISRALAQSVELQDRFVIIDVIPPGDGETILQAAAAFRNESLDLDALKYAAAYTPNLLTSFNYVYEDSGVTIVHSIDGDDAAGAGNGTMDALRPQADDPAVGNAILYNLAKAAIDRLELELPPSPLVAGVYARIDNTRGVWKAPANAALANVVRPTLKITNQQQEDLNVHTTGKSINAIRTFTGKGTLVWGARTLDGNSNEWRYVPVRRFFNFAEESIKKATERFVFEPNDANTWTKVRAMIENFLLLQWRAGALAGAKPNEAFFVKVGLGLTMTPLDILEGRMNVEIGMAVVRPAEFIILKFSHKMQES